VGKYLNIVNHTHWDREWYHSFETFRGKLVEGVQIILNALDEEQFDYFMLDGQTVVLEDLREVMEYEEFARLEKYIREGKISIGPWYVLPDEFLVSGESLIRNLQIGIEISKKYNTNEFVGYLPDTFGHIGQLPQIFKSLGIKWSLLFRGVKSNKSEAYFVGSDGTKIKTLILPLWTGYYNHFLTYEGYEQKLKKYVEVIEKFSTNGDMLLLNGADHLIPYSKLKDRLKEISENLSIYIMQTSLVEYTKRLDSLEFQEEIHGEQRDESKAYILSNVLSSRTYLKIQNQSLEDEITLVTEPMELIKSLIKGEYKYRSLEHCWKTLLKNHPHDSICGCSIDKVHREMEVRNEKLKDMLNSIEHFAAQKVIKWEAVNNSKVFVFNPHPYEYKTAIDCTIILPLEIKWFKLIDKTGAEVPMVIHSKERKNVFKADIDLEPSWYDVNEFKITFLGEFKGLGYKEYIIKTGIAPASNSWIEPVLQNEFVKLWVGSEGYLNMLDKKTGKEYKGLNQIISSMDCGDEYTYSPPMKDSLSRAKLISIDYVEKNGIYEEFKLSYSLLQPKELQADRKSPKEEKIESLIETKVRMLKYSATVYFETRVVNNAKDHRLRVLFPIGRKVEEYFTDVSFDVVRRKPIDNICYHADTMREVKVNTCPTDSYINIPQEFSVMHLGVQECEVGSYGDKSDALYLNLLRSVGWLSQDSFSTRGGGAGPKFETPEAQCLGEYTFKYGLTFEENPAFQAKVMRTSPKVIQGNEIQENLEEILCLDNNKVLVSSFYKDKNENITLRLYNTSYEEQKIRIDSIWKKYKSVDLLGAFLKEEDTIIIKPLQILTVTLEK
jgi:alpha-mannosidase